MAEKKKTDLSIIILNYKTPDLTCDCLKSVYESNSSFQYEIIVFDNNSGDASEEIIRQKFPKIKFIRAKTNYGFAKGNNLAAEQTGGEYLLFLNSDTVLFPNTLEKTLLRIKKDPQLGVLGPRTLNIDQTVQQSIFRFPSLHLFLAELLFLPRLKVFDDYRYFDYSQEKDVDFVIGAFFLIKRKVFMEIGKFDERFFIYAEEADLCLRLKRKNYQILFYPYAEIIHRGGGSSREKKETDLVFLNSKVMFIKKNSKLWQIALLVLALNNLLRAALVCWEKERSKQYLYLARFYFKKVLG